MTTILELAGIACLSVFAYTVWPAAALLVVGLSLILISHGKVRRP